MAAAARKDLPADWRRAGKEGTGKPATWPTSKAVDYLVRGISLSSRWMYIFVEHSFAISSLIFSQNSNISYSSNT